MRKSLIETMTTEFELLDSAIDAYEKMSVTATVHTGRPRASSLSPDEESDWNESGSDSEFQAEACQHFESIEERGTLVCQTCGVELEKPVFQGKEWRFYNTDSRRGDPNRVQVRKNDERSIYKDVEGMPFGEKIVAQANQLFLEVTRGQIYRSNPRKAIICSCIFHAYKKAEKPQTQEDLIKIFGLTRKTSLKGMKFVSQRARKDSFVHTTHITPVDLIRDIMDRFGASPEQKEQAVRIYAKIHNRSFKLNGSRPQSIGSGVVFYWILQNNIPIHISDFAKKVKLSGLTILKVVKEITAILALPVSQSTSASSLSGSES